MVQIEKFFYYLNKVDRIHEIYTQIFVVWLIRGPFHIYSWNASTIDGTNITIYFVGKGWVFSLSIDLALDSVMQKIGISGKITPTLEKFIQEAMSQKNLILKLLNKYRRKVTGSLREMAGKRELLNHVT